MKSNIYSIKGLWSLFLVCAFPLHFWTLILAFRDLSWVTERTNAWDAIGVVSYALLFALLESILVFFIVTLIGFATPKQWNVDKRVAFISLVFLITALWGMISQLLFLWNINLPAKTMQFLALSRHPLWWLYGGSLAIVVPSFILPTYFFLRSNKLYLFMQELIERLSLLTTLYLIFDLTGIIIVTARNIWQTTG